MEELGLADQVPDLSGWARLKSLSVGEPPDVPRLPANLGRLKLPQETALAIGASKLPRNLRSLTLDLWSGEETVDLKWLRVFPDLVDLRLEGRIDSAARALVTAKSLRSLTLIDCREFLSDEGAKHIGALNELESLEIVSGPSLSDTPLSRMKGLTHLRRLKLEALAPSAENELAFLKEIKSLSELSLGFGYGPKSARGLVAILSHLAGMEQLGIHGARLTDQDLGALASMKRLRCLDLADCSGYSDAALGKLMEDLPELKEVKRSYEPTVVAGH
jgi:hypothetical protein